MEKLALEIFDRNGDNGQFMYLGDDASITITDTSEIFDSGDIFTASFTVSTEANAHIFASSGAMHGGRVHDQIDGLPARLWACGLPLFFGRIRLDDEVDVDNNGNIDISFESGAKTFEDMIDGMNARDVPLLDDVLLGMALWQRRGTKFDIKFNLDYKTSIDDELNARMTGLSQDDVTIPWQESIATGWPKYVVHHGEFYNAGTGACDTIGEDGSGRITTLNTDYPYDDDAPSAHPYCNIRVCYQKKLFKGGDDNAEAVAVRGYNVSTEKRANSAPSFYVMYWLRALFTQLNIHITENQMTHFEDLKRLFMLNTLCDYEVPETLDESTYGRYGNYRFRKAATISNPTIPYLPLDYKIYPKFDVEESGVEVTYELGPYANTKPFTVDSISMSVREIKRADNPMSTYCDQLGHLAYATSKCFPDKDVKDIIEALRSGFGVRFVFSHDHSTVRILLLREVFQSQDVQEIPCDVEDVTKTENSIRGFRMTYGAGTEDTNLYYAPFNNSLPSGDNVAKDVYKPPIESTYGEIINEAYVANKSVYITPNNGNAYVVKVDGNADRYKDLHPSLFELAPFIDAEDGICTGDEESIETVTVGFTPLVMNDVNFEAQQKKQTTKQQFALLIEDEMGVRAVPFYGEEKMMDAYYNAPVPYDEEAKSGLFAVASDQHFKLTANVGQLLVLHIDGWVRETYGVYLWDNYDPNDELMSPIEKHDWGLTFGIMRGSGEDGGVRYWLDSEEDEGNDTWEYFPGSSATAHSDTCDSYGKLFDYNGSSAESITTQEAALSLLQNEFYDSNLNISAHSSAQTYIISAGIFNINDAYQHSHPVMLAINAKTGNPLLTPVEMGTYPAMLEEYVINHPEKTFKTAILEADNLSVVVEVDSSQARVNTFLKLMKMAATGEGLPYIVDNGIGAENGRFSLKLRAEKPNPAFDPNQEEGPNNRRYLEITNPQNRRRGLADVFYTEYSYWVRNARIAHLKCQMELSTLISIDKTKRVRIGDFVGFIKKMTYTINTKTGLGLVDVDLYYL